VNEKIRTGEEQYQLLDDPTSKRRRCERKSLMISLLEQDGTHDEK
jgi:hypothetical protein